MNPLQRRFAVSIVLWAILLGELRSSPRRCDPRLERQVRGAHHGIEARHAAGDPRHGRRADGGLRRRERDHAALSRRRDQARRAPNASVDAAVAAAHRATLAKLIPAQQKAIDAAYQAALAGIPDGPAKAAGIAVGEKAAAAVLAQRADDGAAPAEPYRPHAQPGAYVPTAAPAATNWPQRKPWLMASPAQFRPAPPPALTSEAWARDYNEVKALGGKASTKRSAEQTEIARFWEYSLPGDLSRRGALGGGGARPRSHAERAALRRGRPGHGRRHDRGVRGQVPLQLLAPGHRDPQRRHRRQRPHRARRVVGVVHRLPDASRVSERALDPGVRRGHGAPGRAGRWPHAGAGDDEPHRERGTRRWTSVGAFIREVAEARVYEGVHYRTSTEVGAAMGTRIGELAAMKFLGRSALWAEAPDTTWQDARATDAVLNAVMLDQ